MENNRRNIKRTKKGAGATVKLVGIQIDNDLLPFLLKEVYNPKAFFLHAALLGQACAHCPIFPTAASRRSLGRISVPMWPFNLSVRLLIVDLVGRYLTNYLIRREPIFQQ